MVTPGALIKKAPRPRPSARASIALIAPLLAVSFMVPSSAFGAQAWLTSEVLAGKSWTSGANPQVAVDSRGDAFAVWSHRPEFNGDAVVEASMKPAATGSWQTPVRLSPAGSDSEWPVLAIDAEGDVTVAWESRDGGQSDIEATIRPTGSGAWTTPVQLTTGSGDSLGLPDLAVDPGGSTIAIWTRNNEVIEAASKPAESETWQVPVAVSGGGDLAGSPHVAMDANGDVFAVWQRYGSCDRIESATRHGSAGVWQPPVALSGSGGTECAYIPRVAADPQGDAVVTWQNDGVVEADLRPANSGVWAAPVALSAPGKQAAEPRVALDGSGEAIAVWQSVSGTENLIETTSRPQATGVWQAPVILSTSPVREPNIGEFAEVAVDVQGDAVAAWDHSNGSNYVVEATERPAATGVWQTPAALSAPGLNAYLPWVAVFPQGNAVAAWEVQSANVTVEATGYDGAGPMLDTLEIPTRAVAGKPVTFSVSPLDPWSSMGTTTWSFGDGASTSGTTVEHTYTGPGAYQVTLTSADALGNTSNSSTTITVESAPPLNGGPPAAAPPRISAARMTHKRFSVARRRTAISASRTHQGTAFLFTLSADANVRVAIAAPANGLRDGGTCTTPTARLKQKHAKRCTLNRTIATLTRAHESHGADRIAFSGRIGDRPLALGSYEATLTASTATGRSRPLTLGFTVVR